MHVISSVGVIGRALLSLHLRLPGVSSGHKMKVRV